MISERHRGPNLRGEQAEQREELRVGCPVTGQSRVSTQRGHAPPPEPVGGEKADLPRGQRSGVHGCGKVEIRGEKGTLLLFLLNAAIYRRLTTFIFAFSAFYTPDLNRRMLTHLLYRLSNKSLSLARCDGAAPHARSIALRGMGVCGWGASADPCSD